MLPSQKKALSDISSLLHREARRAALSLRWL